MERTIASRIATSCQHVKQVYRKPLQRRHLSTTPRCMVNPFLNLSHFSAAKEAQFLSKEKRIPREEFHPYLQLIRSSEVDPFAPVPGASPTVVAALRHAKTGEAETDTALRLAVSNLIDQVQVSRKETAEVLNALVKVQTRYKREEKNALLMLFATLGFLALVMAKTRALEDLAGYAKSVGSEWEKFDWQWLGSSSSAVENERARQVVLRSMGLQMRPQGNVVTEISHPISEFRTIARPEPATIEHAPQLDVEVDSPRSWLSRLFWAAPR